MLNSYILGIIIGGAYIVLCIGFCANFGVGYLAQNFENISLELLLYFIPFIVKICTLA